MGTSKKPYPVVGQVTIMNFVSSTKSKASFKPPKKGTTGVGLLAFSRCVAHISLVEVEDRSLNDDQLQALYGGSRNVRKDFLEPLTPLLDPSLFLPLAPPSSLHK